MAGSANRERLTDAATGTRVDPITAFRSWLNDAAGLPDESLSTWTATIGGVPIRFRCSDPSLGELYRKRLVENDHSNRQGPVLELDLLETERLGWQPPESVVDAGPTSDSAAERLVDAQLAALMPPAGGAYPWICFDPQTGRGVTVVRRLGDLPRWTSGAPFALLLHLAFAWRGWRLLHAAAVGRDGVGALLAGPGGVGKSGTTLAGISHGLVTVGDDYVALAPGSRPVAWPVYRVLKQDPAGLARIGRWDLADGPVNWMGKVELDLDTEFPGRMARALELRLILLPEIAGKRTSKLQAVPPSVAFSAIAPSVLTQLPGARLSGFAFLTRLTRALPAYRLRLSAEPAEIAETLGCLLET